MECRYNPTQGLVFGTDPPCFVRSSLSYTPIGVGSVSKPVCIGKNASYSQTLFMGQFGLQSSSSRLHLHGQNPACRAVAPHQLSPAEKAYSDGFYAQAEELYAQALAQQPQDAALASRLVETLLTEDKLTQAVEQMDAAIAANPKSAAVLTAKAEVQVRRGQPWLAMQSLDEAAAADPCYARVHLVRSRIFRIDSMYASERAELQKAYDIDVTDPDILMAWSRIMPAAQRG